MSCGGSESISVANTTARVKTGFLRHYYKKEWLMVFTVLHQDSQLVWYEKQESHDAIGAVYLNKVCQFLAIGPYTNNIPNRPKLPGGATTDGLIAIPQQPSRQAKINWFLFADNAELGAWMTTFGQVLPPPPQQTNPPQAANAPTQSYAGPQQQRGGHKVQQQRGGYSHQQQRGGYPQQQHGQSYPQQRGGYAHGGGGTTVVVQGGRRGSGDSDRALLTGMMIGGAMSHGWGYGPGWGYGGWGYGGWGHGGWGHEHHEHHTTEIHNHTHIENNISNETNIDNSVENNYGQVEGGVDPGAEVDPVETGYQDPGLDPGETGYQDPGLDPGETGYQDPGAFDQGGYDQGGFDDGGFEDGGGYDGGYDDGGGFDDGGFDDGGFDDGGFD